MDLIDTVNESMNLLNLEYPTFQIDPEGKKLELWVLMLRDFKPSVIQHAVYHLISLGREFPPNIGQVRDQCAVMTHGELQDPVGAESWERIKQKMTGNPDLQLTELEKKALAQTSSIYDLKRSTNPTIDRAHYIKAFDHLVSKRHLDRQTLPEVKALVSKNTPALTAPESKQLPHHEEPEYLDPAKITELCKGVVNKIGVE